MTIEPDVTIIIKTKNDEETLEIHLVEGASTLPPISEMIDDVEEEIVNQYFLYDVLKTVRK